MTWEMAVYSFSTAPSSSSTPNSSSAPNSSTSSSTTATATSDQQQKQQPPPSPIVRRWTGYEWQTHPQLDGSAPAGPPPCRLPAAAGQRIAAAAAPQRGAVLPAEVLASRGLSSTDPNTSSSSSGGGGSAAVAGRQWEWGLPLQGANLNDPEVCHLVWRGLNYNPASAAAAAPALGNFAAQALLTAHYSLHGAFLLESPLLDPALLIPLRHSVPCIAVQGGDDLVTPPATAVALSEAWPEAEVVIVEGSGHSMYHPSITHELVSATDRMRALVGESPDAAGAGCSAASVCE